MRGVLGFCLALLVGVAPAAAEDLDEYEIERTISRLGGKVLRDPGLPGRPITSVEIVRHELMTDEGLRDLGRLEHLRVLDLSGERHGLLDSIIVRRRYARVTDAAVDAVASLSDLRSLSLSADLTDAQLNRLTMLDQLEDLALHSSTVSPSGLSELRRLKKLTRLDLDVRSIRKATLGEIAELTSLVVTGSAIDAETLADLKHARHLAELGLFDCPLRDEHLRAIGQLDQLTTLALDGDFTDEGVKAIAGLRQLSELVLMSARLTDAGVAHLQSLDRVSTLMLSGKSVTDNGLQYIQAMEGLASLHLFATGTTNRGMNDFIRTKPDVKIDTWPLPRLIIGIFN